MYTLKPKGKASGKVLEVTIHANHTYKEYYVYVGGKWFYNGSTKQYVTDGIKNVAGFFKRSITNAIKSKCDIPVSMITRIAKEESFNSKPTMRVYHKEWIYH